MSIDLKKDRWFIRVNSVEESIAVQEWLFEQGITWCTGSSEVDTLDGLIKTLTSCYGDSYKLNMYGFMWDGGEYKTDNTPMLEIKLKFKQKLSVSDVIYPTKESPQQAKIRELEETINKAQEQLRQLKEEV